MYCWADIVGIYKYDRQFTGGETLNKCTSSDIDILKRRDESPECSTIILFKAVANFGLHWLGYYSGETSWSKRSVKMLRPGGAPEAWAWAFRCLIEGYGPAPADSSERSTSGQWWVCLQAVLEEHQMHDLEWMDKNNIGMQQYWYLSQMMVQYIIHFL